VDVHLILHHMFLQPFTHHFFWFFQEQRNITTLTWFFIYLEILEQFQWKSQWYTGHMLSLKLSHQRKLWLLPFLCHSMLSIYVWFSHWLLYWPQEIMVTWASRGPKWVLRSEASVHPPSRGIHTFSMSGSARSRWNTGTFTSLKLISQRWATPIF